MKLLGIDYGTVYTGIAVSDKNASPQPLTVIKSKSDQHKIDEIVRLSKEENIDKIIIGNGSGKLENHIRGFINNLTKAVKKEVVAVDETLTSNFAFESMVNSGLSKKKRKDFEHAYAAAIILKIYEDNN